MRYLYDIMIAFLKKTTIMAVLTAALLCLVSCNKSGNDTGPTAKYFSQYPSFTIKPFCHAGERLLITPSKPVKATSDTSRTAPGICWKMTGDSRYDTVRYEGENPDANKGSYILVLPEDTLMKVSLTCFAYASGYYDATTSQSTVIVDEKKSLTGRGVDSTCAFTDPRDEKLYFYTRIGDKLWMSTNLAYEGEDGKCGHSVYGSPVMDGIVGRMYSWNEAVSACPPDWELPSQEDINELAGIFIPSASFGITETIPGIAGHMMSDPYFNGEKYWEYWPAVPIDNATGLCMLPAGYASIDNDGVCSFQDYSKRSVFWTAEKPTDNMAVARYIYDDSNDLGAFKGDIDCFGASVRCVKSAESD